MSFWSAASLYRRSLEPAERPTLPVPSLVDCLPPALARTTYLGVDNKAGSQNKKGSTYREHGGDFAHPTMLDTRAK